MAKKKSRAARQGSRQPARRLLHGPLLHAELGQIVAGLKAGRQGDDETILFWHRGLSLSDIALGHAMLEKAKKRGVGQRLRFY